MIIQRLNSVPNICIKLFVLFDLLIYLTNIKLQPKTLKTESKVIAANSKQYGILKNNHCMFFYCLQMAGIKVESVQDCLENHVPEAELKIIKKILYGREVE